LRINISSFSKGQTALNNNENNRNGTLVIRRNSSLSDSNRFSVLPDVVLPQKPQSHPHKLQQQSQQQRSQNNFSDQTQSDEYRQAIGASPKLTHQERSFIAYGFNANNNQITNNNHSNSPLIDGLKRNLSQKQQQQPQPQTQQTAINVNVAPQNNQFFDIQQDTPEIRKYRKKFNSDILCAALWGVNLLIGSENSLMLLDRSGQGKVYQLITRRRFVQMEVLESINILVTISGKKNKIRVYYLSWLKNKIFKTDSNDKRPGYINVGELEGCVHFKIVQFDKIKFLVVGLKDSIEVYAWAQKPYFKFMAFKSFPNLQHKPLLVDLAIEDGTRMKVLYGSNVGFHVIELDSGHVMDIYIPQTMHDTYVQPHTIVVLPNSNGMHLLLCFNNEGVYVDTSGKPLKNTILQWGELPSSVAYISNGQIMGWGNKAIEIRNVETGQLDGVFMHKRVQKLKFLCERNDKVFFSSMRSGSSCQIYFMTLNKLSNW
jgi:TRAF2 and NCK interacting kinase